jgi:signal transduction histidine kinase
MGGEIKGYGGNGLLNMRRRAERLGGVLSIDSGLGAGTTTTCRIPTSTPDAAFGLFRKRKKRDYSNR